MNPLLSEKINHHGAVIVVFLSGLIQGLALVSFPALAPVLKSALSLSDAAYGAIFLPQIALTAAGAVAGGVLSGREALPGLLRLALLCNGMSQVLLLVATFTGSAYGWPLTALGTSFLGLGFGLSAAPLNRYPVIFFPNHPDSAITALHTLIGAGLAIGPLAAGMLAEAGVWQYFPITLILLILALSGLSLPFRFPAHKPPATAGLVPAETNLFRKSAIWLLFTIAVIYAFCEGLFSNWAIIFLQEDKQFDPQTSGLALSAFWAALASGRLLTAWLVLHLPATRVWLSFPLLMSCAFLALPAIDSAASGIAAYSLAGFGCSGFFPLTVGRASAQFRNQAALVSSLMIAALMLGVGLGSFTLGALRNLFSLSAVFHGAVLLPLLLIGLGFFSVIRHRPTKIIASPASSILSSVQPIAPEGMVICPACGGQNPEDAVFCGNHQCHKALGEFKYVLEELSAQKNWIEKLADRVSQFVSGPHFITLHVFWFAVWILANEGYLGKFGRFDEYPYALLGIVLAIEAILITGFLLISQHYQYDYSEKRAELDYEISIRCYRKLTVLEKRLEALASHGKSQADQNISSSDNHGH